MRNLLPHSSNFVFLSTFFKRSIWILTHIEKETSCWEGGSRIRNHKYQETHTCLGNVSKLSLL
jgi:hypothetical protein